MLLSTYKEKLDYLNLRTYRVILCDLLYVVFFICGKFATSSVVTLPHCYYFQTGTKQTVGVY